MSIFDPVYRQEHVSGQIARMLFGIGQAVKHMLWDKSKLEHLTPAQIQVLLYLNFVRADAATVNTIAKFLACTPATVSGILDVLQSKKLIQRKKKSEDRRKVHINLTPKGTRAVEVVQDVGNEIEELVTEFTQEEQELLGKLLVKMSKKLISRGYIVNTDICSNCAFFNADKIPGSEKPHFCEYLNLCLSETETGKECPDFREILN